MKKHGFTMVELMIVIAIIAVLASIIMPKMTGARQRAQLTACKANLKHLLIAIELYANDNKGAYAPAGGAYYTSNYLVTSGHLKRVPTCPLGNPYWIYSNYPSVWRQHTSPGSLFVICYNQPGTPHNSSLLNCPYVAGDQVYER